MFERVTKSHWTIELEEEPEAPNVGRKTFQNPVLKTGCQKKTWFNGQLLPPRKSTCPQKDEAILIEEYVFQPLIFKGDLLVFGGVHPQKTPKKGVSGCKKKTKFRGLEDFFVPNLHQGGIVFSSSSHPFFGVGCKCLWVCCKIPTWFEPNYLHLQLHLPPFQLTQMYECLRGGRITYPTWGYVKIMCLRKRICSPNISGT